MIRCLLSRVETWFLFIFFSFILFSFFISIFLYLVKIWCDITTLLFLLPPSCMVVPIGNIANKFFVSSSFSPSTTSTSNDKPSLPTVSSINNIGIDKSSGQAPACNFKVRGKKPTSTTNFSRESLIASSGRSTPYHKRMDLNIDSDATMEELTPELSYETEQEKALQVSMAADQQETMRPPQHTNSLRHRCSYRARFIEWIIPPHFTPQVHQTLCFRL